MYNVSHYDCPSCGAKGRVTWVSYDGDCRGNDGGYHINCNACEKYFTADVMLAFLDKQKAERKAKREARKNVG